MVKYLVMDVNGSLTDGKIYMGQSGEAMKAFSVKDGYAVNYILKPNNIIPIIITARVSDIVSQRCEELGITEVYQGKHDKLSTLVEIVGEENFPSCAYFGDDILDRKCMLPIKEAGGIIGCPSDAVREVKAISDYVCLQKAGEGALREFSEWLISEKKHNLARRCEEHRKLVEERTVQADRIYEAVSSRGYDFWQYCKDMMGLHSSEISGLLDGEMDFDEYLLDELENDLGVGRDWILHGDERCKYHACSGKMKKYLNTHPEKREIVWNWMREDSYDDFDEDEDFSDSGHR